MNPNRSWARWVATFVAAFVAFFLFAGPGAVAWASESTPDPAASQEVTEPAPAASESAPTDPVASQEVTESAAEPASVVTEPAPPPAAAEPASTQPAAEPAPEPVASDSLPSPPSQTAAAWTPQSTLTLRPTSCVSGDGGTTEITSDYTFGVGEIIHAIILDGVELGDQPFPSVGVGEHTFSYLVENVATKEAVRVDGTPFIVESCLDVTMDIRYTCTPDGLSVNYTAEGPAPVGSQVVFVLDYSDGQSVERTLTVDPSGNGFGANGVVFSPTDGGDSSSVMGSIMINGVRMFVKFYDRTQCGGWVPPTQTIQVPTTPQVVDDPNVNGDAHYVGYSDTVQVTYTSNPDGSLTATTKPGYVFPGGETTHTYPKPVDQYTPPSTGGGDSGNGDGMDNGSGGSNTDVTGNGDSGTGNGVGSDGYVLPREDNSDMPASGTATWQLPAWAAAVSFILWLAVRRRRSEMDRV